MKATSPRPCFPHSASLGARGLVALCFTIRRRLREEVILAVQDPLDLNGLHQPRPDLMLVRPRPDYYRNPHPTSADVLLPIEVADTSWDPDSTGRAELYARAAIREYWLIDLRRGVVFVHTDPTGVGYARVEPRRQGESWAPHALPELCVSGTEVFG